MTDDAPAVMKMRTNRFRIGILLAWIPIVVIFIPTFFQVFRRIANQKATGLGAVAGGFSEAFITFGVVTFIAAQVLAIFLLTRSIGIGGAIRNLFAILSVGICVLSLAATGLFFWILWFVIPRLNSR